MILTHSSSSFPRIIVNNISIPLKPLSTQEQFSPSPETITAWYLAHYGTSNLFDLDPKILAASIEELAEWWTQAKSEVVEIGYLTNKGQLLVA